MPVLKTERISCSGPKLSDAQIRNFEAIKHKIKRGREMSEESIRVLMDSVGNADGKPSDTVARCIEAFLSDRRITRFVLPRLVNERIRAQSGAFMIDSVPFHTDGYSSLRGGMFDYPDPLDTGDQNAVRDRFIIPSQNKKEIMKQLDLIGVNEASLFPDLEHRVSHMVKDIREKNANHNARILARDND